MSVEMGLGTCGVCQGQIGEGAPIGVLSHAPFIMGHKDCVDKRKAENLMVKISRQDGPAGPIGEYADAMETTVVVDKNGEVETPPAVQAPEGVTVLEGLDTPVAPTGGDEGKVHYIDIDLATLHPDVTSVQVRIKLL